MHIKRIIQWEDPLTHFRNIEISLAVSSGKNFTEVGKVFDLTSARIGQIYNKLIQHLSQELSIKFLEKESSRIQAIKKYKKSYLAWVSLHKPYYRKII
jgi:hypothetical protein